MLKEKRMDVNFRRRLQRRLYYGDLADLDTPSLPLTELAVDYFHDSVPEKLGHIDLYTASNVIKKNRVSPCSMVLSMLYAKRLRQQKQRSKEYLQTMSSSDVFFISVMMASKYLYDEGVEEEVFNDEWADNTDQDVDDVNQMEIDFLEAMDWKLFVRPHEFEETLCAIERRLALQEGLKRGWFTYSEMDILMDMDLMRAVWWHVGAECSRLVTAISAAYLTSLLSMMGSTALALHISGPLSSGTVALLTLQASPIVQLLSAGLPSLNSATLSASLGQGFTPSTVRYKDMLERNESAMDMAASALESGMELEEGKEDAVHVGRKMSIPSDMLNSRLGASSVDDRNASEDDDGGGSGDLGDDHGSSNLGGCGGKSGDEDGRSTRSTNPSWWSLWFLDSLLSQLWAVTSMKSKLVHSEEEPIIGGCCKCSCTSENTDCDHNQQACGTIDENSPGRRKSCFRRWRKNQKHQDIHSGTKILQVNSRTTSCSCVRGSETNRLTPGLHQSFQTIDEGFVGSCSCGNPHILGSIHPWCNWPCRLASSPSEAVCDPDFSKWSHNQPNFEPPHGCFGKSDRSSPSSGGNKNPSVCSCGGGGDGMGANRPRVQNREPHFTHAIGAKDPPEEWKRRLVVLPPLENGSDLFRVPLGFVTSISQVLQAA